MSLVKITSPDKLEDAIQAWLEDALRTTPLMWNRFYDTKSAGAYLPPQPSDFHADFNGVSTYIEAKFSRKHLSLRGCFANNVDSNQVASARLAERAGASYWFVFYSGLSGLFEAWPGHAAVFARHEGKPLTDSRKCGFKTLDETMLFILTNASFQTKTWLT